MAQEIKTVGQFFKILITTFQDKKPDQFNSTFKLLANKEITLDIEKLKTFESLQAHKLDAKNREVYEILDYIRLWTISRALPDKQKIDGFNHYLSILSHALRYLDSMNEGEQWFVKCIRTLILFSKKAFEEAKTAALNIGESPEKPLENYFQNLRYYKSSRSMDAKTKKQLSLLIETMQVSIYFGLHNYTKCERGLELVKRDVHAFNPEELNLFHFQYGKLCLINHRFRDSEQYLEKVIIFNQSQKKLILRYLIPCKIFLGKMCITSQFPQYLQITKSIITGNFRLFQESMEKYQKVWIKRGLYLLMQKMRSLVWRNFIKRVYSILGLTKIPIENIVKAIKLMGGTQDANETVCIISNLIFQGYMKGYIYCGQSKVLVLKNDGAFVPFSKVAD